jgi:adenine-specific DNA methylase
MNRRNGISMSIEDLFPTEVLQSIAKIESQRRQFYRPIYSIHKSWARRPGSTFRAIGLSHFLGKPIFDNKDLNNSAFYQNHNFDNKIALDPFCGGGTSLVELNRLGVKTIGIDINPVAWFTTKKELDPFDEDSFNREIEKITQQVGKRIKDFYKTECPKCDSHQADIMYTFWVRTIPCPTCNSVEDLFKYYIIGKKQRKSSETMVICPNCDNLFYTNNPVEFSSTCSECKTTFIPKEGNCKQKIFTCTSCSDKFRLIDLLKSNSKDFSSRQIAIEFYCPNCLQRDYKRINNLDIALYENTKLKFLNQKENLQFPRDPLPTLGSNIKNLTNYGFKKFADLFNFRQIYSLSLLFEAIYQVHDQNLREYLIAAFSSCLEFHTVLCPYNYTMKQIVNIFNFQSFLIPLQYVENNVWGTKKGNGTFITYLERIRKAKRFCKDPFEIALEGNKINQILIKGDQIQASMVGDFSELKETDSADTLLISGSSVNLKKFNLPDQSIDLVITDPPYFDYIQYTELANFFYVWLKLFLQETYSWFKTPLIVSEDEVGIQKIEEIFLSRLTAVFSECYRVLKEESPLIFTFHHSSPDAWLLILLALNKSRFVLTKAFSVYSEFKARPVSGENRDLILVCRKDISLVSEDKTSSEEEVKKSIEEIFKRYSAFGKNNDQEGRWEKLMAEILPLISSNRFFKSKEEILRVLQKIFSHKN